MPKTLWERLCFIPTDGSVKRFNWCSPSFENCGACVRHSNGSVITTWSCRPTPIQGTRLVWKIPSQSLIRDILRNPFYAGAYVWGRRPVTTMLVDGRLEKRQSAMRPAEECRVFIRDHHVGYIDWPHTKRT